MRATWICACLLMLSTLLQGPWWLWHHLTDSTHCVAQFTSAGCEMVSHHHGDDSDSQAGHDHRPAHNHDGGDAPADLAHDDCAVCHLLAGSRPFLAVTAFPPVFYLPFIQQRSDVAEAPPLLSPSSSCLTRGPPTV